MEQRNRCTGRVSRASGRHSPLLYRSGARPEVTADRYCQAGNNQEASADHEKIDVFPENYSRENAGQHRLEEKHHRSLEGRAVPQAVIIKAIGKRGACENNIKNRNTI